MPTALAPLPALTTQAERLIELGLHRQAGVTEAEVRAVARSGGQDGLLVIHADRVAASALAPLMRHGQRSGFVVEDMTDVDAFAPVEAAAVPPSPLYLLRGVDRGDEMAGWSPDEALPAIVAADRTPLTLTEGIHWVLQQPDALARNQCFMTIGSRLRRPDGRLDARTPALWLSNGTGRDGAARRDAPKVGWCWARNRHTWLGFASASGRSAPAA
ncbi:hypothetical protein Cs7R123_42680 [Catellatospora sp. TT07R-123]|uniref:DUF5701 family protein n=1 Tax=Catellatospora sp. TT07R-123 TaxID=2733863 RepID=UPI001B0E01F2|nr:DUF5701 family protein [Catellatospora sp. TT07R-123]GHJ46926.1 hypothetical protein Cs7R123_42680 [Catellatospora sp. TT07R-123]